VAELPPADEPEPAAIPIEGVLDLHAFDPREVPSLVRDYLEACRERGILEVRLIHGQGTGALRETVHAALRRLDWVEGFGLAGESAGGWGATIARLKPIGG